MSEQYKWSLRKGGKKERCPQCGKLRFVPFVLTADPTVKAGTEYGRCDREQSCGYFRYPGGEVKAVQKLLIAYGCGSSSDIGAGEFGNLTKAAVIKFQNKCGLVEDGIVGEKTWAHLLNGGE